ncbi:MAG: VOC family protein [Rhizobacter sp.]|nr:VOC family protein [Rhizobacter sp.]
MKNQMIFVNLPVKDLARSRAFYESLGYPANPQFSDDKAACMVVNEGSLHVMLMSEPFARTFTTKPLVNAKECTEMWVCLTCESRNHVNELVARAVQAGGRTPGPAEDHGFMYGHGFEDLDGHHIELVYMDPNAAPNG